MNHLPWSEFFGPSLGAEFIVAFEPGNEIGCHTAIRFLVFFGEENVDQIFQNKKASLVRGFLRSGDWTRTSDLRVMRIYVKILNHINSIENQLVMFYFMFFDIKKMHIKP